MARVRRVVAIAAGLVALAGCNVAARVAITVHDDGTGVVTTTVTLDGDAVVQLGGAGAIAQAVPLADLRDAGWTISPWRAVAGGGRQVTLSHPFANQTELVTRVTDLAGPNGILRAPTLSHRRGWFGSRSALALRVDLHAPAVDIVRDSALADRLRVAHVDPAKLQAQLASKLRSALHLSVVLQVPGAPAKTFAVPAGEVQTLRVAHDATNWDHVVKFGIGVALGFLALAFGLAATVGVRRNRRRRVERARADVRHEERAPTM